MQLRNSKEVSKEDYNTFYKSTFKEFIDPQAYTHFSTEVCQLTRVCLQCCTKVLGPSLDKTYFRENIEKFVSHLCIIVIDLKFLFFNTKLMKCCWSWWQGEIEFKSLLYIPGMAPFNSEDMLSGKTKNIKLYVKRVFISDEFDGELVSFQNLVCHDILY